jgi:hypothetical protein
MAGQESAMTPMRTALRTLVAIAAAVVSLPVFGWLVLVFVAGCVQRAHPNDPSAGDGAAWLLVYSAPLIVPMLAGCSIIVGLVVWRLLRRSSPMS